MRKGQFWGENLAAHCKVFGHSTVRCAKTAEPIDMPFWTKTRVPVRPWNHVLDRGADPPGEEAIFGHCVWAIQKHWQSSLHQSLQSRCKRDHSLANNVMQQKGTFSI